MSTTPLIRRSVFWAVALGIILLLAALVIPCISHVTARARRAVDASNLRQIGQAALIYASDHDDNLPPAADVWDYARMIANEGFLDVPRMWLSMNDPAADEMANIPTSTLIPGGTKPHPLAPAFRQLKPSVAVALGKLNSRMPATTPIAWTRGLQPDGTWSAHSPYGTSGGYIVFLAGNVAFYKNLTAADSQLVRFDGKGPTSNILEALPPGSLIGEYTPTPEEKTAWARSVLIEQKLGALNAHAPLIFLVVLWLPFIAISIYRLLKKRPGAFTVLLWPVFLSIILFVIMPDCW
ncbi:MAG: hypothetical protein WC205_16145 [Opitutaceae bacterium]